MFHYRLTLLTATALLIALPSSHASSSLSITVNNTSASQTNNKTNTEQAINIYVTDTDPTSYTLLFDLNAGSTFEVGNTPASVTNSGFLTFGNETQSATKVKTSIPNVSLLRGNNLNLNVRKVTIDGFSNVGDNLARGGQYIPMA